MMNLTNSPQFGGSQYELLKLPQSTRPLDDHSNPHDSPSDTSRSLSPARSDLGADINHDSVQAKLLPHSSFSKASTKQGLDRNLYLPLALTRISFTIFLTTFVLLAGVLVLLFGLSVSRQGIANVDSNLYYVWTYGPTAIFTAVAVFWNQVEWRMMQWLPWSLMYGRTKPAKDSILLDYHSFWNVWAMIVALRRKHFRVTLAVLGNLLITGLTVASTGLFAGEFRSLAYDTTFQMLTRVDPPGNLNLTVITNLAYTRTFLITDQNATEPLGTHQNSVYETFYDKSISNNITASFIQNSTFMANVTALTFNMDCENATVITNPRANTSDATEPLALVSSSCTNTSANDLFVYTSDDGNYKLSATVGCCSCGPDDGVLRNPAKTYGLQQDNGQDWRLFVFASRFKQPQTTTIPLTAENSEYIGFICKPLITANLALASLAQDMDTTDIRSNLTFQEPQALTGFNKSSAVQIFLAAYRSYILFTQGPQSSEFLLNPGDNGNITKFFNVQYLQERISTSVPAIMAQVANSYFMSPAQSDLKGYVLTTAYRLVVRNVAFSLMLAGLVLLSLISGILLSIGQRACTPCDPSSIGSIAAISSQSSRLKNALYDTGTLPAQALEQHLSMNDVKSEIDPQNRFSVGISGESSAKDPLKHQFRWWRPFSSQIWFRVLTISAPVILIVILEAGLQISIRNGGVATVTIEGAWHYFWLYWPPVAVFVTRVFVNMVDFNTKLYQPFYMLSRGRMDASRSLSEFIQGKIALVALFIAVRKRYWAVVASTTAVVLSPFLSIIVASLWNIVPATTSYNVTLRQLDRWNFSDSTGSLYYSPTWYPGIDGRLSATGISTYLGQEGVIPSMILNYNLSYPKWTSKDFVLPTLGVDMTDSQRLPKSGANITISGRASAIRANLNCQVHTSAKVSWWSRPQTNVGIANAILTNISYDISGLGNSNDNCGYLSNFTIGFGESFVAANPPFYGESVDTRLSRINLTTRSDCPTRLFFLSSLGQNPVTKALVCRPQLEEVQVDVTLNYPDLTFSASRPPVIVSSIPPRVILDGFFNSSHATAYSDVSLSPILNEPNPVTANNSAGLGDVFPSVNEVNTVLLGNYNDDTFSQIVASFGTSLEDMFNDPELMKTQVEQLHSIVVGQVLRSYGREINVPPSGNDLGQAPIAAVLSTPNERERLVQNLVVTRVLEGLLGIVLICLIVTMALQHTRHVVPKEPSSIGAVMSLLAGAGDKFWNIFDKVEGCEWMSDAEREKSGMFEGVRFRMGWERDGHFIAEDPVTVPSRGFLRRGYRKVNMNEAETVGGVRRRWCIDVDEQ